MRKQSGQKTPDLSHPGQEVHFHLEIELGYSEFRLGGQLDQNIV